MQSNKNDFSRFEKFLSPVIRKLAVKILKAGGRCVIVGGWIRDRLLGIPIEEDSDIDIEVFGISYEKLYAICLNYGIVVSYPHFGIVRLKNIDLSLPRTETLLGEKYNDFDIKIDPNLTFSQAACRRDFSVNAIGWNFLTKEVFDPFDGINTVKQKYLIPLTDHFKEDSYRVLRAVQFIARFNFKPSDVLINFSKQMNPCTVSQAHINLTQKILQTNKYKNAAVCFLKVVGSNWEKLLF